MPTTELIASNGEAFSINYLSKFFHNSIKTLYKNIDINFYTTDNIYSFFKPYICNNLENSSKMKELKDYIIKTK